MQIYHTFLADMKDWFMSTYLVLQKAQEGLGYVHSSKFAVFSRILMARPRRASESTATDIHQDVQDRGMSYTREREVTKV